MQCVYTWNWKQVFILFDRGGGRGGRIPFKVEIKSRSAVSTKIQPDW